MAAHDDFQTAMSSAATYLAARDYSNARLQVILARMHLARIPNSAADGVSAQWREDLASVESSITMESGRQTRSVTASCEFVR
jgi:hypothetical protein